MLPDMSTVPKKISLWPSPSPSTHSVCATFGRSAGSKEVEHLSLGSEVAADGDLHRAGETLEAVTLVSPSLRDVARIIYRCALLNRTSSSHGRTPCETNLVK